MASNRKFTQQLDYEKRVYFPPQQENVAAGDGLAAQRYHTWHF